MKKQINQISLIICIIIVSINYVAANDWSVKIQGERDNDRPYVMIGLSGNKSHSISSPPEPLGFKCFIMLVSLIDNNQFLNRDIRKNGNELYEWILSVNNHGEGPPVNQTCQLSWELDKLGPGMFTLSDYSGNILINDMKKITTYSVTSNKNKYIYYRITYNEVSISHVISNLKTLSGITSDYSIDTNMNGVIEMKDTIRILNYLAEIYQ